MADTMQAAVLHAAGDLRLERIERPKPQPGEALVRIRANGLCGSDIHFFEAGRLGPFVVDRPYVPGHEAVGEVVEVNSAPGASSTLTPGQRVVIEPGIPCRRCEYCRKGLYNLCGDVRFLSAPPENGTFAEYAAVASDFCYPVPDEISDEEAALVEPVSVGIHACNRAGIRPGEPFAIVGVGPIGLINMLVAFAFGAGPGYVLDLAENRRAKAVELGANRAFDPREAEAAIGDFLEYTGGGVPFVFDTSGSSVGCAFAPRIAAKAGVVTLVGWPELSQFEFPVELVIERELDIRGINRYRNTYPTALGLMHAGKINVRELVSHRFRFDQVVDAFAFASENRDKTIKVIISG